MDHQLLAQVQKKRIKSISIVKEVERILLYLGFYSLSEPIKIDYEDCEPDTLVSSEDSDQELVENSNFITVFSKDLWKILGAQKSEIQTFKVSTNDPDAECFQMQGSTLQAKNVTLEMINMAQASQILTIVDPGPLHKIDLKLKMDHRISEINDVLKMEPWMKKEGLEMDIILGEMDKENLECLKEILTRTRIFKKVEVYYEKIDESSLNFLFGLPLPNLERKIQISNSETLKIAQTSDKLTFRRETLVRLQYSPILESFKNLRILQVILGHLNGLDMERLRKVNRMIRNGIDFLRPAPGFRKISIKVREFGRIQVVYDDQKPISYQKYGGECLVGNQWIDRDYRLVFLNDFEIMMSNQRGTLELLSLNLFRDPQFAELFRSFLESKIEFLRVESLVLEVFGQHELLSILPYLNSVKKLEIKCAVLGSFQRLLAVDEISKAEQWRDLEELVANSLVIFTPIREIFEGIENLKSADVLVNEMTMEDLLYLKETLHHSPNLSKVKISFKRFSPNSENYRNPEWPEFDHLQTSTWYYRIPNSQDIFFIFYDSSKSVSFSRIDQLSVPENTWID